MENDHLINNSLHSVFIYNHLKLHDKQYFKKDNSSFSALTLFNVRLLNFHFNIK